MQNGQIYRDELKDFPRLPWFKPISEYENHILPTIQLLTLKYLVPVSNVLWPNSLRLAFINSLIDGGIGIRRAESKSTDDVEEEDGGSASSATFLP